MRTFNTPAQARSLREIEAAAITPVSEQIKDVYGEVQSAPVQEPEVVEEAAPKPKPKRQPKSPGRKRILRRFDEVPLGYSLRMNTPLEYDLIMQVVGSNGVPDADLIEAISYASTNPFFRTELFRLQLIKYRKNGCTAEHPKVPPSSKQIQRAIENRKNIVKRQK